MASFKELSLSRPMQPNPRQHAHSISLGAVNSNHRVTRRKSVTTTPAAANAAAAVAANMKDTGGESGSLPVSSQRRGSVRKGLDASSLGGTSYLSRSMNSPARDHRKTTPNSTDGTAIDGIESASKPVATKNRNRRASEGSHLQGRRPTADLRCDRCGKGYKHGSCLSKHMWEHDPAWAITSKLLISKHQQVQLLEAASVLVNMNQEGVPEDDSESSSASPDASSEVRGGLSSVETTPPPAGEVRSDFEMSGMPSNLGKRLSVSNSGFSRSYQSIPSSSFTGSAPIHSPAFSHFRHSSIDTRPSTANTKLPEEDEADLAAAIGLCNFGTPRTGPVSMSPNVPPVPPLPTRYLDQSAGGEQGQVGQANASTDSASNAFMPVSYDPSSSYKVSDEREVHMGDAEHVSRRSRNADVDFGRSAHADEDDDGVFGQMEE